MAKNSKKKNKKVRNLLIIFLFIISLVMTTGTFAYWATNVEGTQSQTVGTISIGSASGVSTSFILSNDSSTGGNLVPEGMNLSSEQNAVEEIKLTYDLEWVENNTTDQLEGTLTKGNISVTDTVNIFIDGEVLDHNDYSNIYDLIVVTHSEDNPENLTLDADAETFEFTITMEEPENQEEYNMIVNAEIQVVIDYEIEETYTEDIEDNSDVSDNVEDNENEDTSVEDNTNDEEEPDPSTYYEFTYGGQTYRYFYDTGALVLVP